MRHTGRWALAVASLMLSTSALSQDFFSSTNSTVHSYNYLELQYLLDVDASPPVLATMVLDISNNWSLKAEYLNQDFGDVTEEFGFDPDMFSFEAEAQVISVGGLYHAPLASVEQTDWIAGLMLGRIYVSVKEIDLDIVVEDDSGFQEVYAGFRRTFSPRLEGEATLSYFRTSDDSDTTADVTIVYRAFEKLDVALAGNELGDADIIGIGLRYTW